jgi:hypothetical protein
MAPATNIMGEGGGQVWNPAQQVCGIPVFNIFGY